MVRKIFLSGVFLLTVSPDCISQVTATFNQDTLFVKTPLVQRGFIAKPEKFYTTQLKDSSGYNYSRPGSKEFELTINNRLVNGTSGDFHFQDYKLKKTGKNYILTCHLEYHHEKSVNLNLKYSFDTRNPVIRKWIEINNNSNEELKISDLRVEKIMMDPWGGTTAAIYGHYASYKYHPPYTGWAHDPFIWVKGQKGVFGLGNEAPGILKETGVYDQQSNEIRVGLTPRDHAYPFALSIQPGDNWKSPASFIILTQWEEKEQTLDQYLGSRDDFLPVSSSHEALFYNTWNPFRTNINDSLVINISKDLKKTGLNYLIIDDGWQDHFGDWNPHPKKFPNGLKPVCDSIRKNGLTPGLWLTPFTAETNSEAFQKFKQHAIKDQNNNAANLHGWANDLEFYTMDATSPWFDYILDKTSRIIERNGIGYVKLDFAVIKSAYVMDPARSGSYDTTSVYSGRAESLYRGYEALFRYCDSLRARFPDLLVDITFELYGHNHIVDYALMKHAHLDWISNFEEAPPLGPAKIREMAYKVSNALPSTTLLIGNQVIEGALSPLAFASNMASTPVLLGKPKLLNANQAKKISQLSRIYQTNCASSDFIIPLRNFRADHLNTWDGFVRMSRNGSHGLIFVFRNQSLNKTQTFDLNNLPFNTVTPLFPNKEKTPKALEKGLLEITLKKENDFFIGKLLQ